jgi:hypothetical protein
MPRERLKTRADAADRWIGPVIRHIAVLLSFAALCTHQIHRTASSALPSNSLSCSRTLLRPLVLWRMSGARACGDARKFDVTFRFLGLPAPPSKLTDPVVCKPSKMDIKRQLRLRYKLA